MIGYLVAEAKDEGRVEFYVPRSFGGDWEHFAGVVQHLFLDTSGVRGEEGGGAGRRRR